MKILIIEDDINFQQILKDEIILEICKNLDFDIDINKDIDCIKSKKDLDDFIQNVDNYNYDVVISDIVMGNGGIIGYEDMVSLLSKDKLKESKVLIFSGYNAYFEDAEFILNMIQNGAFTFVRKGPYPNTELKQQLQRVFEQIIKENIRSNLGKFLPTNIRNQFSDIKFWKKLEKGFLTKKAILWCDITNSTKFIQCQLKESTNPNNVPLFLNEFYNKCADKIHSNNGVFDKFTGDGFLAYFCAEKEDNDEKRQCECAMKAGKEILQDFHTWLQSATTSYQLKEITSNEKKIDLRLIVDWGEVFWGVLRSDYKNELTVLTTTVIRGKRLLDHTITIRGKKDKFIKKGKMYSTESVFLANQTPANYTYSTTPIVAKHVKDFEEQIKTYEVCCKC